MNRRDRHVPGVIGLLFSTVRNIPEQKWRKLNLTKYCLSGKKTSNASERKLSKAQIMDKYNGRTRSFVKDRLKLPWRRARRLARLCHIFRKLANSKGGNTQYYSTCVLPVRTHVGSTNHETEKNPNSLILHLTYIFLYLEVGGPFVHHECMTIVGQTYIMFVCLSFVPRRRLFSILQKSIKWTESNGQERSFLSRKEKKREKSPPPFVP